MSWNKHKASEEDMVLENKAEKKDDLHFFLCILFLHVVGQEGPKY